MKFKKRMIILVLIIFVLFSIAGVCACDVNDIAIDSEDTSQIDLSQGSDVAAAVDDNLEISKENGQITAPSTEEIIGTTDNETLHDDVAGSSDGQNILGVEPDSGKSILIDDVNIRDYFTSSGDIIPNTLAKGDTIIFGNLNDKTLNIDMPLIITSNGTEINENTINLKRGSDNSIIVGLVMANDFTNAINIVNANNVKIINNTFSFYSLGRNNQLSAITADSAYNLTIAENEFKYIGKDDDGGYNSNNIINIIDSDVVAINNNTILFDSESAAPAASDRAIRISDSNYVVISGNRIAAAIPSRAINWLNGEVYSECVSLEDCKNVTFVKNAIGVASSGSTGTYDTIYGVHITGENVTVYENAIAVVGAPYGYGLVVSAENFNVVANMVFAGVNWTNIVGSGSASLFNVGEYSKTVNFSELYEKLINYFATVKGNLMNINQDNLPPYACAIEIEGTSRGAIEFNLIGAGAVSPYGIYAANWAGDVQLETAFNLILGVGNSAFGMDLTGSEALVKYSLIALFGNFTTGIASSVANINITHNAIESMGSDEGTPLGYDMMGIETTGVHIVSGDASITKNIINTTGEYAVDLADWSKVTENKLVANVYTGDASVNYAPRQATVKDNTPKMQRITINASDVKAVYGDNIKYCVNVTDYDGYNALSNITVQLSIGKNKYTKMTDKNGVATFSLGKIDVGEYNLTLTTITNSSYAQATETVKLTVNKIKTQLTANSITTTYNIDKKLVITLKDSKGNPISNVKMTVDLNGTKEYNTDKKGQVKVSTQGLAPKNYVAKITFAENAIYKKSSANVDVVVKKANPKMVAKAKTFKDSDKNKKYTITLKDNKRNAIKNANVILNVNGKTYAAKTNSKGQATFNLKELTKAAKYNAVILYKGDKYYNKLTKKAAVTVKSTSKKVTFKTVGKGSKDSAMVKKIQRALKNNGYYLTYDGHYLMVDGIFESCTERSVKEFQANNGLQTTGNVDYATAKKLKII